MGKKMWHIQTMKYYPAKKVEILPNVITWMEFVDVILREIAKEG